MPEPSGVAFGRYLRELRLRQGLTLRRACELTLGTPEALDKGTLSRLERGLQFPSIFKLGPLSRLYEISADALIERMELDREAERVQVAAAPGQDYKALRALGREALLHAGRKSEAYAYFRDAAALAADGERVGASLNLVTAIRALGRNVLALHELRAIEPHVADAAQRALLHERMSACSRCLGEMWRAERYAETAAGYAREAGDRRLEAYACAAKANAAIDQEKWSEAAPSLKEAMDLHRDSAGSPSLIAADASFEAQTRLMLADCYIHLNTLGAARRLTLAAKRISEEHALPLGAAYAELLLGRLSQREGDPDTAAQRWRKAASLAAQMENQRLAFTVEIELFRQALQAGDPARARASQLRLERLAPWVPHNIPAIREYKSLLQGGSDA